MNNKELYINDVNQRFEGKTRELLINQINLFYQENVNIKKKNID